MDEMRGVAAHSPTLEYGDLETRTVLFMLAAAAGFPALSIGPYPRRGGLVASTIGPYTVRAGEDQWRRYCRAADLDWLAAAKDTLVARGSGAPRRKGGDAGGIPNTGGYADGLGGDEDEAGASQQ
jgi:hypothetical protein